MQQAMGTAPPLDRKSKKPLMEKRRRARINKYLLDLKALLLDSLKRDPAHTSKLEKADILEMTVHLLRSMQRHQLAISAASNPSVLAKFQKGWADCAGQVTHYANSVEGFDSNLRGRLLSHLDICYRNIDATRQNLSTPGSLLNNNGQHQLKRPDPVFRQNQPANAASAPYMFPSPSNRFMAPIPIISNRAPSTIFPNIPTLFGSTAFIRPPFLPRTSNPSGPRNPNMTKWKLCNKAPGRASALVPNVSPQSNKFSNVSSPESWQMDLESPSADKSIQRSRIEDDLDEQETADQTNSFGEEDEIDIEDNCDDDEDDDDDEIDVGLDTDSSIEQTQQIESKQSEKHEKEPADHKFDMGVWRPW